MLMIAATVLGLWFGLTAPDTTPIIGPIVGTSATSVVVSNIADTGGAPVANDNDNDDDDDANDGRGHVRGGDAR